jgi:hypothetical protein
MSTLKTLALAAFAATTIGTGAAMAQTYGHYVPGDAGAAYNLFGPHASPARQAPTANVPAGSSDVASPWGGSGAATDSPWYTGGGSGG